MVTHLLQAASLLVLTFLLLVQLIPHAVGQRQPPKVGKKSGAPTGGCPTPWRFVADMPQELAAAAGASDGTTYSYHAGGINNSLVILDTLYRYDPVAGSWTSLMPMPQAAAMPSCAGLFLLAPALQSPRRAEARVAPATWSQAD